jgi:TetR/AcrR family transcriptional repressor of nem operon
MSRPKGFDRDAVLERAIELFWARGYAGTSITDLEHHLDIGRQSLYDTFGDKRALFLKALDRYSSWTADRLAGTLLAPDSGLGAVRAYLQATVELLTPPGQRKGCLIANSILAFGQSDAEVSARCLGNQALVTEGFRHALTRAVERGEVALGFEVEGGATMLMAHVHGLAVLARGGTTRQELLSVVSQLMSRLQRNPSLNHI